MTANSCRGRTRRHFLTKLALRFVVSGVGFVTPMHRDVARGHGVEKDWDGDGGAGVATNAPVTTPRQKLPVGRLQRKSNDGMCNRVSEGAINAPIIAGALAVRFKPPASPGAGVSDAAAGRASVS